jgi:hypothetical protein
VEDIVAGAAAQHVVAAAAEEFVVARAAKERVVAGIAEQLVVEAAALQVLDADVDVAGRVAGVVRRGGQIRHHALHGGVVARRVVASPPSRMSAPGPPVRTLSAALPMSVSLPAPPIAFSMTTPWAMVNPPWMPGT